MCSGVCFDFMLQTVNINMSRKVHLITFLPSSSVSTILLQLIINLSPSNIVTIATRQVTVLQPIIHRTYRRDFFFFFFNIFSTTIYFASMHNAGISLILILATEVKLLLMETTVLETELSERSTSNSTMRNHLLFLT